MDVVFKFPLKKDISLATMPGNSSLKNIGTQMAVQNGDEPHG